METPVSEELHEIIRLNSFGERSHTVFLNDKQLSFNDTKINLTEISHIKFGAKITQLGMFPVGRTYRLSLQTSEQELNLFLRSFWGIRDNYLINLYEKLVNGIWLRIGDRLIWEAINCIKAGNSFAVGPCTVSRNGISLEKNNAVGVNSQIIGWTDLFYEKKYDRLVINSKSNRNLWLNLYFLEHWNVEVLMEVLDWLFKEGGVNELQPFTYTKE